MNCWFRKKEERKHRNCKRKWFHHFAPWLTNAACTLFLYRKHVASLRSLMERVGTWDATRLPLIGFITNVPAAKPPFVSLTFPRTSGCIKPIHFHLYQAHSTAASFSSYFEADTCKYMYLYIIPSFAEFFFFNQARMRQIYIFFFFV